MAKITKKDGLNPFNFFVKCGKNDEKRWTNPFQFFVKCGKKDKKGWTNPFQFFVKCGKNDEKGWTCLLYTSPSPRDATLSRMPSSA